MKVLQIIREQQIEVDGCRFCPLSQQEIADLIPCSKLKLNQMMKEMIDHGYVVMLRKRGRYIITKKANTVIQILEKEYLI